MFTGTITSKRVAVGSPEAYAEVPGDRQCRGCSIEPNNPTERVLLKHQCITGSTDCRYARPGAKLVMMCIALCSYRLNISQTDSSLVHAISEKPEIHAVLCRYIVYFLEHISHENLLTR